MQIELFIAIGFLDSSSWKNRLDNMFDYYKHTSMFWNDMISMMASKPASLTAVGPLRNFTENIKKISQELIESNQEIVRF